MPPRRQGKKGPCQRHRAAERDFGPEAPVGWVYSLSKYFFVVGLTLILVGCARPNNVRTYKSPYAGLYYTVEDYYASGPASDTNKVYAHFDHDGKTAKLLVLEGENLTVTGIVWATPSDATLCVNDGITSLFRNEVTLFSGDASMSIHNHLQERCESTNAVSARGN
jgi:hypothetical protein